MQIIIYVLLSVFCVCNVAGFVVFGTDVDNYDELVKVRREGVNNGNYEREPNSQTK